MDTLGRGNVFAAAAWSGIMNRRLSSAVALSFVLATGLLLVVRPAAADPTTKQLGIDFREAAIGVDGTELKNGRLAPEVSAVRIRYVFDVRVPPLSGCILPITANFWLPDDLPAFATPVLNPRAVTRTFDGNEEGNSPLDNLTSPSGTTMRGWETTLTVQFNRDAPAFKAVEFKVKANVSTGSQSAAEQCTLSDSPVVEGSSTVKADYVARVQYRPQTYSMNAGQNGQVTFRVEAVNEGNGPTRITTGIEEKVRRLDGILPPIETILESKAYSGEGARNSQIIQIAARTPHSTGYSNKVYTFEAHFLARADISSQTGELAEDLRTITFAVKVQGVYVPGFDATGILGGLAVAGLAFSRLRRTG